MRKATPAWLLRIMGTLLFVAACQTNREGRIDSGTSTAPTFIDSTTGYHRGLLYGRVTLNDGRTYEGRLRFGGDEEALWSNFFNGAKRGNPWDDLVPPDEMPTQKETIAVLGVKLGTINYGADVDRPFMTRFGDIARIEAKGRELNVTLKSGTVVHVARYGADDFADGVRVWDARGVVNLVEWGIRSIEFLGGPDSGDAPLPLYGSVRTAQGVFTGLIQWNREQCLASDILYGVTSEGRGLRFDEIRSIARRSHDSAAVTLRDGREVALTSNRGVSPAGRGIYVDDARYGRVLIEWDALQHLDFSEGGTGPAYGDFIAGHQLAGSVTTRSGRTLKGRLVYDLDESETTETLDAQTNGVNYSIPFGMIAAIALPAVEQRSTQRVKVSLRSGEELLLERDGDLADRNGGMLIFVGGSERPEYLKWAEIAKVEFEKSVR